MNYGRSFEHKLAKLVSEGASWAEIQTAFPDRPLSEIKRRAVQIGICEHASGAWPIPADEEPDSEKTPTEDRLLNALRREHAGTFSEARP